MQIELPSELEPFVEQEFATGRYATREEVVTVAWGNAPRCYPQVLLLNRHGLRLAEGLLLP